MPLAAAFDRSIKKTSNWKCGSTLNHLLSSPFVPDYQDISEIQLISRLLCDKFPCQNIYQGACLGLIEGGAK